MSQPIPDSSVNTHDAELNRAIDELRGVLTEDRRDAPLDLPSGLAWSSNASIVMNIPVDVQIVLGSAEMQVSDLLNLQKGATVALNRRIGEPVDVIVNGRRVARGEITVMDNDPSRFGVRLTEIVTGTAVA